MKARLWGLGAALGLLVLCAPLLMWDVHTLRRSVAAAPSAPLAEAGVPAVVVPLQPASAPAPIAADPVLPPRPAPAGAARDPMQRAFSAAQQPYWDLCGLGRIQKPATRRGEPEGARHELPAHLGQQVVDAAVRRMLDALAAGSARQRWGAPLLHGLAGEAPGAAPTVPPPADDAVALDWALRLCESAGRPCDPALARRWTELEPDNGMAWLAWAQTDAQQREAALVRASQARTFSTHNGVLLDLALKAMPADVPAYALIDLWLRLLSAEHATFQAAPAVVVRHCRPAPAAGSERQALCARLGRLLFEEGDTLFAQLLGTRTQELAGMPAEQAQAQRKALYALGSMAPIDLVQPYACASIEALRPWIDRRTQGREIDALRADEAAARQAAEPAR